MPLLTSDGVPWKFTLPIPQFAIATTPSFLVRLQFVRMEATFMNKCIRLSTEKLAESLPTIKELQEPSVITQVTDTFTLTIGQVSLSESTTRIPILSLGLLSDLEPKSVSV